MASHAEKYGATTHETISTRTKRVIFSSGPLGTSFDIGAEVTSAIQASTGCFLAEDVYRNIVTPQQVIDARLNELVIPWENHLIP